ncbi:hypothetical protein M422DRAFT_50829 [Sphaerobolus stellatus SS14]|uniref:Uncharacterized protein n=1 Tax=Sphaerobolus stellatus (strain SS14) TaxID=990650 RepID=A0A0C9VHU6_SPHS4|nr:hypothetical protein M422DRAFT_50829 [Sphaerobolus stellatus SS14]
MNFDPSDTSTFLGILSAMQWDAAMSNHLLSGQSLKQLIIHKPLCLVLTMISVTSLKLNHPQDTANFQIPGNLLIPKDVNNGWYDAAEQWAVQSELGCHCYCQGNFVYNIAVNYYIQSLLRRLMDNVTALHEYNQILGISSVVLPEFTIHGLNYTAAALGGWEIAAAPQGQGYMTLVTEDGHLRLNLMSALLPEEQLKPLESYRLKLIQIGGPYKHSHLKLITFTYPFYGLFKYHTHTHQYQLDMEIDLLDPYHHGFINNGFKDVINILVNKGSLEPISI